MKTDCLSRTADTQPGGSAPRVFVGFGFGPIQAGLFLFEAARTGRVNRLVVAEVVPETVAALRKGGGRYAVNVATADGIEAHTIDGVEAFNPRVPADRDALVDAVADAQELATALPSVRFYGGDDPADVAAVLRDGLRLKAERGGPPALIYAAENHNHAAELLANALGAGGIPPGRCQCLNTVIGKMSGTVTGRDALAARGLVPVTATEARAFLVEAFSRILVERAPSVDFERAILAFEEKDDLLPFEEAKLYGHNATHAMLGYLLRRRGATSMHEAALHPDLMALARGAFLDETGAALCRRYAGRDPLFTPDGFRDYVDDLLARMINPHLGDAVDRVTRDPERKLGWDDRLIGAMRLVLAEGREPHRLARGARAALDCLPPGAGTPRERLEFLWDGAGDAPTRAQVWKLIEEADHES
jgi:mannitol-1-phosphate 5-dehydrogenase